MGNAQIEQQLVKLLREGNEVTVQWDCGGDEAFARPAINGTELDWEDEFGDALEEYIIEQLNLPSAGEFYLKGGGKIFIEEDRQVVIEHRSVGAGVIDYDEEEEKPIYSEEEEEKGRKVLFVF